MFEDTICVASTPPINSPIAIIRISGPESSRAVSKFFTRADSLKPRYAAYGSIIDGGEIVDDVVVVFYCAPKSYTGEDMAEIFCHGNPIIVNRIIRILLKNGVRMAEPGEFTKRGFLNGKMDLTGAEAINHIITARSEWEIDSAIKQMHGSLRNGINEVRNRLIELKADVECGIDFIDEDIEFVSAAAAAKRLDEVGVLLKDISRRCQTGARISHGIDLPIIGKPNVGKSSILNLILNYERAIVSSTPGTTRDLIKEGIRIGGIEINLIDTAGIDETSCEIEKMGINLSLQKIDSSSLIIMVLDSTTGIEEADKKILNQVLDKKTIILLNKIDALDSKSIETIQKDLGKKPIPFSAKTGAGMKELEREITELLNREFVDKKDFFVADLRMMHLLDMSIEMLININNLLSLKEPPEIIAFELQGLLDTLSEITGEITPEDVLDSIFSRFCIGK